MKPLPIRIRLTVWYSVMFATAALLLSLTSWWMLRRTIDATLHQDFEERIDDIRKQLYEFSIHPTAEPMETRFDAIYHLRDDGKWLQILDSNGAWIYRSQRMIAAEAPLALPNSRLPSSTHPSSSRAHATSALLRRSSLSEAKPIPSNSVPRSTSNRRCCANSVLNSSSSRRWSCSPPSWPDTR